MKFCLSVLLFFSIAGANCQVPGKKTGNVILLPNGWSLSPAGRSLQLGDLPLNMVLSKTGKLMAVTNNGQSTQTIQLIDPQKEKILDEIVIAKSWYGLKFSADEKRLYASGGNDNRIMVYKIQNQKLLPADSIYFSHKKGELVSTAGIEIDDQRRLLYTVTKEDNSVYVVDLVSGKPVKSLKLPGEAYACILSPDKMQLYISCWGCDKVLVFDTRSQAITATIMVGDNPNEMLLSKNGRWLYVANANDNTVSVINVAEQNVVETLDAALFPGSPSGSTTNGIALSKNEKTLYIANADNNCLGVFDVSDPGKSHSIGFIPVGWYPTNVKTLGNKIFVTNGKGFSSMANPHGPNPVRKSEAVIYQKGDTAKSPGVQYIAGLFKGTLSIIPVPTAAALGIYAQQVYANTPYNKSKTLMAEGIAGNPIPMVVGEPSPIKYVFYVIKENRTYDQVLGDIKKGNGDESLVLFGNNITPNQHKLANEFVLLDNFYVDAEVSADGHNWSTGAYATDFLEKTWPTSYGGRGGKYSAEGNREIANNKAGFIWDHCKKYNVSYRSYGEFADDYTPNIPVLKDHFCTYFAPYGFGTTDSMRFFQWKRDFDSLLAINQVPQFNTVRFPNDHTEGLKLGRPTPFVHVADNDRAVGWFIEHLSKSPIWKETAVFIVEDDAQNGSDHVDAHRSTAYLAGGFVKRNFVDHTMYSTTSMLRTMELILGMPPMTQYDAAAVPMWNSFMSTPDTSSFKAVIPAVNFGDKNVAVNKWQKLSEQMNFAVEDAVPDVLFNELLWYAVKGESIPFPGPKRAAFLKVNAQSDDDD